jgi:amphi-Trp domain-containing protein
MPEVDRFEHECILNRQSIHDFLASLVDGFEKGRVILTSEDKHVQMVPAELIRFYIKTKKKSGKSKLTIKLAWKDSDSETYRKKSNDIQISA